MSKPQIELKNVNNNNRSNPEIINGKVIDPDKVAVDFKINLNEISENNQFKFKSSIFKNKSNRHEAATRSIKLLQQSLDKNDSMLQYGTKSSNFS